MPKILTDAYRDATFFVPQNVEKTEGFSCTPLPLTLQQKLLNEARKEAGGDDQLVTSIYQRKALQNCVKSWVGYTDVAGVELECSPEVIKEICNCDPSHTTNMQIRLENVARLGELEERKN